MTFPQDATWFITGCTSGFGHELSHLVLERGYRAVVTARDVDALQPLVRAYPDRCLALPLDVTDPAAVQSAVARAAEHFGGIDVLVNNAGRGMLASIEDARDQDVRALFELNFHGLLDVTRRVLPLMRSARRGWIVNFSSTGGLLGRAGSGFYAATKFAVEALSEALAQEVEPFGIHVTIVEPSGFRTRFQQVLVRGEVGAYDATVGRRMRSVVEPSRQPAGDPRKGAEAILLALASGRPPLRLPLGADAVEATRHKIELLGRDLAAWEAVARGADAPPARTPSTSSGHA